jgi:hypothetical protein
MKPKKKMSMYNKGGFNPRPDTSYQSSASKAARKNVAKKQKEQDMQDLEFIRSILRQSRHATLDGSKGEKFDVPKSSKKYNEGGKTNDIPYFLRKDYVEGGRRSAISADASSPYEKARDKRSMNYDRLAESATINVNEALSKGEMSKEEHEKAKKAIQKFKENKDNAMRESGYGRTPKEKKAQDRAIRRMKNRKAKGGMKVKKYQEGGMNATGETGRSTLSSATKSGRTAYQQRQDIKKKQMDLFEKELSEKGVYLPKQGQLVKELNVDYPIIPSKDESGRTVPFKKGYIRRGYSGADTRMNQKLGVKPIGQNLSK